MSTGEALGRAAMCYLLVVAAFVTDTPWLSGLLVVGAIGWAVGGDRK